MSIAALFVFSCLACTSSISTSFQQLISKPAQAAPTVVGTWTLAVFFYQQQRHISKTEVATQKVRVLCNSCPEITFRANGTGVIKREGGVGDSTHFTWQQTTTTLYLRHHSTTLSPDFADGPYQVQVVPQSVGGTELQLVDANAKGYILR